jgi:primosomal protein N' (replication factor Y)
MATPGRLRLKAQVIARDHVPARDKPYARLWVDTGVFHLDDVYDYAVSEDLAESIDVGIRVQVPFNGREVEGIVLERCENTQITGTIKPITKVLSIHCVADEKSLQLISKVAQHWCTNPFDIIRSAVPPRIARVDKSILMRGQVLERNILGEGHLSYVAFTTLTPPETLFASQIVTALAQGSVLVIAPDESDVIAISESISKLGENALRVDSSQPREVRYENYLKAMRVDKGIVIGSRSAIFTPVNNLATIFVYKESSHEHYEIRSPGWNVRDVAFLRREIEHLNLVFTGYVPSLEISRLIEDKEMSYHNQISRLEVKDFFSSDGALLPGRIFLDIRKALAAGPVLFLIARKGYGNALVCAHCRNIAMCTCGSRLNVSSKDAAPSCPVCLQRYPEWSCKYCQHQKKYVAGRGIERAAEEISRAFPGFPILLSYGDVIKKEIDRKAAIVIATPGATPKVTNGYSAVVILEGIKFFSHPDLRAQERARELFFETAAMVSATGSVLLCIDQTHPIVSALMRWNPALMIQTELAERQEIPLPPFVTSFVITGPVDESAALVSGLHKAIADQRIPVSTRIFGPIPLEKFKSKIVVYCLTKDSQTLTSFLHELQRRRSIAKKEHLIIRVDPYSL